MLSFGRLHCCVSRTEFVKRLARMSNSWYSGHEASYSSASNWSSGSHRVWRKGAYNEQGGAQSLEAARVNRSVPQMDSKGGSGQKGKGKGKRKGQDGSASDANERLAAFRRGEAIAGGKPVWNFAFGANINPWKLEESRGIKPLETVRGKLEGWRLVFTHRGGFGSIERLQSFHPEGPSAVHGMLLQLVAEDFATLCKMEHQYEPLELEVEAYDGRLINARAFITMPGFELVEQNLAPTERYLRLIREGAEQSLLDPEYVVWLKTLSSLRGERGPEYYRVRSSPAVKESDARRSLPSDRRVVSPFSSPTGVFVRNGSVYVADSGNNRVLRFPMPTLDENTIATLALDSGEVVAGGNGKGSRLSQLNRPFRIYVSENHDILVADRNNNRVLRWQKGSLEGEIVAGGNGPGNGLNQLDQPSAVYASQGHIFVSDRANHRVVRWDPGAKEGVIVAGGNGFGSSSSQLACPGGICVTDDGTLIVSDEANNRIQAFEVGAKDGVTLAGQLTAGGGSAELYHPLGLCFRVSACSRDLVFFVGDSLNYRVQQFAVSRASLRSDGPNNTTRAMATVAGGKGLGKGTHDLGQPISVSVDDASGALVVADSDNGRIQVVPLRIQEENARAALPSSTLRDHEKTLQDGIVAEFRSGGFGFITSSGKRYFAHHTDIALEVDRGYPTLSKGDRVQFFPRQDAKWGQRATSIQKKG